MKKILWLVALLVALPSFANAGDLTGYDGGFFIKNEDGTFKLTINGRVQPKVAFTRDSLPDDTTTTPAHYQKTTSFSLRRAEMAFSSEIQEKLGFSLTLRHSTNSQNFSTVNITGVEASYTFVPEFVITTGMVGLPLSMMTDTSSKWFLLVEPPMTELQDDGVADFTVARASFSAPDGLGIKFSGDAWKFHYALNVVNGAESNYRFNDWNRFSAGTRVSFDILDGVPGSQTDFECSGTPKLTISAGGMYQAKRTDPGTGAIIKYMLSASTGIALRWGGFAFTTEGYYRRMSVPTRGTAQWWRSKLTDVGYYGTAGYYIIPKTFEVALQAAQIFRQGPDNNANQFGGGVNYYIFDNNLKLQLAYTWTEDYDDMWGAGDNNHIHNIALMASARF